MTGVEKTRTIWFGEGIPRNVFSKKRSSYACNIAPPTSVEILGCRDGAKKQVVVVGRNVESTLGVG